MSTWNHKQFQKGGLKSTFTSVCHWRICWRFKSELVSPIRFKACNLGEPSWIWHSWNDYSVKLNAFMLCLQCKYFKKSPKNNKQPKPYSHNVPSPICWRNTNTRRAQKVADQRKYMYSFISHQLPALMLEYWAGNIGGVLVLIFLISHFV